MNPFAIQPLSAFSTSSVNPISGIEMSSSAKASKSSAASVTYSNLSCTFLPAYALRSAVCFTHAGFVPPPDLPVIPFPRLLPFGSSVVVASVFTVVHRWPSVETETYT
jgi:hypothetical protein